MKRHKKIIGLIAVGVLCVLIVCVVCYRIVLANASGKTYDNVEDIPHRRVGLLPAISPVILRGEHNYCLDNSIMAAVELYEAGKIDLIIVSGVDYSCFRWIGCDVPRTVRDSLVAWGIPENRIILDYEGLRTLNSIAKANLVYGVDSLTLISQRYHNERAIYLADRYGINAIGYNAAPSPIRRDRVKNSLREFFTRPRMFLDFLKGKKTDYWKYTISIPTADELTENKQDSSYILIDRESDYDELGLPRYFNSVKGHKEEQSIVGNFTGNGIDTIYLDYEFDKNRLSKAQRKKYGFGLFDQDKSYLSYAVSHNPKLPPMEVFNPSGLVYEGDVDGDGKDEWGYLYSWWSSQWRQYRIYTLDTISGTWKHLYYGDRLDTPIYVRASGVEIVEKGPRKGWIKINWGEFDGIVHDTIVRPTFTPISKDAL